MEKINVDVMKDLNGVTMLRKMYSQTYAPTCDVFGGFKALQK